MNIKYFFLIAIILLTTSCSSPINRDGNENGILENSSVTCGFALADRTKRSLIRIGTYSVYYLHWIGSKLPFYIGISNNCPRRFREHCLKYGSDISMQFKPPNSKAEPIISSVDFVTAKCFETKEIIRVNKLLTSKGFPPLRNQKLSVAVSNYKKNCLGISGPLPL